MKKIITVFILLLTISTALFSKEKKESRRYWGDIVMRSISTTIDETTLYIYADKQHENLDIQIQDIDGTVVYTNRVSLQAGVEFMISVSNLSEGTSQIVLIVNDRTLGIISVK